MTIGRRGRQQLLGECAHLDRQLAPGLDTRYLQGQQTACCLGGTRARQLTETRRELDISADRFEDHCSSRGWLLGTTLLPNAAPVLSTQHQPP